MANINLRGYNFDGLFFGTTAIGVSYRVTRLLPVDEFFRPEGLYFWDTQTSEWILLVIMKEHVLGLKVRGTNRESEMRLLTRLQGPYARGSSDELVGKLAFKKSKLTQYWDLGELDVNIQDEARVIARALGLGRALRFDREISV